MILSTLDIVYLASMFDHQGGVYISKENTKRTSTPIYRLDVIFQNQKPNAMREFRNKLNYLGNIRRDGNSWRWVISNSTATDFLDMIFPYLRLKREEVEIALRLLNTIGRGEKLAPGVIEERESYYQQMKSIKLGTNNA